MSIIRPSRRAWHWLSLLVALYLILGLFYILFVPPQEKLDEFIHWDYVRYLREFGLPDQRNPYIQKNTGEFHQPPLYYLIAAALTSSIPLGDPALTPEPINNYGFAFTLSAIPDNANGSLHDPANLRFPWHGDFLSAYVLRTFSLILGALTLIPAFWLAWTLFENENLALGSVAWLALRPSVLSINTTLSNDPLLLLLGTIILLLCARIIVHGSTWRRAIGLGLVLGLTALTKFTWIATAIMVPAAFLLSPSWKDERKQTILQAGAAGLIAIAITSWWFIRNLVLYGDLSGIGHGAGRENFIAPRGDFVFADMRRDAWLVFMRYWAHFGARGLPQWMFYILLAISLLLLAGLIYLIVSRRYRQIVPQSRLMVFVVVLSGLYILQIAAMFPLTLFIQARFAYAGYAALALTQHLGLLGILSAFRSESITSRRTAPVLAAALIGLNIYALWGVLRPAYDLPRFLTQEQVEQAFTTSADITFSGSIHLVGYSITPDSVRPGETTFVTLCWETGDATTEAIPYGVHIIDPDTNKIGERNTHPGLGMYPTLYWEPDHRFCDEVRVPIDEAAPTTATYDVTLRYFDEETLEPLPAALANSESADIIYLGQIAVLPDAWPAALEPTIVAGENGLNIHLAQIIDTSHQTGEDVMFDLQYHALTDIPLDLTIFVHIVDDSGEIITQTDTRPLAGRFPSLFWPADAVIEDSLQVSLENVSPGTYRVTFGLYETGTGVRLPLSTPAGQPLPDNLYEWGHIEVR